MGVRQARDSKRCCCWNVSGILKFIKEKGKLVDLEVPWNSGCIKRKQAFWSHTGAMLLVPEAL